MNRKSVIRKTFSYLCVLLSLTCCTERIHEIPEASGPGIPVSFSVSKLEQLPFAAVQTRAGVDIGCSMLTFAVYSCDSLKRLTYVNQKSTDASFGTFSATLEQGRYKLMVLAHSTESHPSNLDPKSLEFQNPKTGALRVSDTFLYFEDIEVDPSKRDFDISLSRVVGKFELCLTDNELPSELTSIKFAFSDGGSWSLDATTGLASKKNSLTATVPVVQGVKEYGVYTFIYSDKVSLTITAMNGNTPLKEIKLDNVPVTKNYITRYTGEMFAAPMTQSSFKVSVRDDWAGTTNLTF